MDDVQLVKPDLVMLLNGLNCAMYIIFVIKPFSSCYQLIKWSDAINSWRGVCAAHFFSFHFFTPGNDRTSAKRTLSAYKKKGQHAVQIVFIAPFKSFVTCCIQMGGNNSSWATKKCAHTFYSLHFFIRWNSWPKIELIIVRFFCLPINRCSVSRIKRLCICLERVCSAFIERTTMYIPWK